MQISINSIAAYGKCFIDLFESTWQPKAMREKAGFAWTRMSGET